jgi:hypothetical protein
MRLGLTASVIINLDYRRVITVTIDEYEFFIIGTFGAAKR